MTKLAEELETTRFMEEPETIIYTEVKEMMC